ncbi:hypothetical protein CABS01_12822 [Colletotrichum abscissum]|uniref:Uncharacterized protein n=1 Tax=Colletotrichum abscissum TaxID=1671311 RepID=A0A9P9XFD7_9PEZI|nr:uncharacterized protein CABS01_12822 [Colletotrichum abscissum]KAI3550705.1 hypothetical protein CABS02_07504 [Colletotrichum abscissum]KAK1487947.1 hypothetical protein CABS01_12822 [Colletotrichum abscissum]
MQCAYPSSSPASRLIGSSAAVVGAADRSNNSIQSRSFNAAAVYLTSPNTADILLQIGTRERGKAGAYSYPLPLPVSNSLSSPSLFPFEPYCSLLRDPGDPSDHCPRVYCVAALQTRPVLRARLQTDAHPDETSGQCL